MTLLVKLNFSIIINFYQSFVFTNSFAFLMIVKFSKNRLHFYTSNALNVLKQFKPTITSSAKSWPVQNKTWLRLRPESLKETKTKFKCLTYSRCFSFNAGNMLCCLWSGHKQKLSKCISLR